MYLLIKKKKHFVPNEDITSFYATIVYKKYDDTLAVIQDLSKRTKCKQHSVTKLSCNKLDFFYFIYYL